MDFKTLTNEFLSIIDYELLSMSDDEAVTLDKLNGYTSEVLLPVEFMSYDNQRIFEIKSSSEDNYYINVYNVIDSEERFSKNGIEYFNVGLGTSAEKGLFFFAKFFEGHAFYNVLIKCDDKRDYFQCKRNDVDGNIKVSFSSDDDGHRLTVSSNTIPRCHKELSIIDGNNSGKRIVVKQDRELLLHQRLEDDEVDEYFESLAGKTKTFIEQTINGINALNGNIFDTVVSEFGSLSDLFKTISNSDCTNEEFDRIFNKYFDNTGLDKDYVQEDNDQKRKILLWDSHNI